MNSLAMGAQDPERYEQMLMFSFYIDGPFIHTKKTILASFATRYLKSLSTANPILCVYLERNRPEQTTRHLLVS